MTLSDPVVLLHGQPGSARVRARMLICAEAGRLLARQIPDATLVEIEGGRHALTATHGARARIAQLIRAASERITEQR